MAINSEEKITITFTEARPYRNPGFLSILQKLVGTSIESRRHNAFDSISNRVKQLDADFEVKTGSKASQVIVTSSKSNGSVLLSYGTTQG